MRHLPVLIPILPLLSALLCLIFSRIERRLGKYAVLAALAASFFSSVLLLVKVTQSGENIHYYMGGWMPSLGIEFVVDPINAVILAVISVVAFFVCMYSQAFLKESEWLEQGGFYALFALLSAGLLGMTITGDMFNLYVFLEIASISGYGLIALGRGKSVVASFRYLLLGTIAASFYLLSVAYLYAITGTLNMADMSRLLMHQLDTPNVLLAVSMLIVAFGLKMALFPLHGWQPDAYTYAHPAAAPIVAGLMSKAPALALLRYLFSIITVESIYVEIGLKAIGFLGACGIILGSVMANAQKDFRRMLAYSSVAQIGYIAVGLSLGSVYGLIAAVYHMVIHAFMKSLLFMVSGALQYRYGEVSISIDMLGGLNKHMPLTTASFVVAALSMIGIPPTGGFFSKWYLLLASLEKGQFLFIAVIVASSLLNAVYFFRVIENIFISKDAELTSLQKEERLEIPFSMLMPIVLFGIAILAVGLFNSYFVEEIIRLGLPEVLAV